MIHKNGYWTSKEETDTHEFDAALCKELVKLFRDYESVVDIGCGRGDYVKEFIANGINCVGYDGSPLTPELSEGKCFVMDFSQPAVLDKFEVVLSLEVGEHIPAEYEQNFIDNLANASSECIILSWAVEGQAGIGHVNCRNNDYIISEFEKRGFRFLFISSMFLRRVSTLPWFKNTLMVFYK